MLKVRTLLCILCFICPTIYVNKDLSCLTYGRAPAKGSNPVVTRNRRIAGADPGLLPGEGVALIFVFRGMESGDVLKASDGFRATPSGKFDLHFSNFRSKS